MATIKEVLTFRLQESAVDAILTGKRKGQNPTKVANFSQTLSEVQAAGRGICCVCACACGLEIGHSQREIPL
eukprot:g15087.t1